MSPGFCFKFFLDKFGIATSIPPGVRRAPSFLCKPDTSFLRQSEHFAMEMGKQPIIFENPMYASRDSDVKVVHQPTQVRSHSPFFQVLLLLNLVLLNNALLGFS